MDCPCCSALGVHTRQWPLIPLPQNNPTYNHLHAHLSATSICTTSAQLIPPNSCDHNRSSSSHHSTDFLTNPRLGGRTHLARTTSNCSDVSTCSGCTPSVTSVNYPGSTTLTKRMITPLCNLQAHNVMTNVVLERWDRRTLSHTEVAIVDICIEQVE